MKKKITVQVVIEIELIDGEPFEVATGHVAGTGVRGVCQVIGGGDTETKAAEAARAAVRKLREITGDDFTEELTFPPKLRAVESQACFGPDTLLGCIAGR